MKKLYSIIMIMVFVVLYTNIQAQDTIVKKTGEKIIAKVVGVNKVEIQYRKLENPDGPIYAIERIFVLEILYANGLKENFLVDEPNQVYYTENQNTSPITLHSPCTTGQNEAANRYKARGVFGSTLTTTLLFSPAGLITAIAVSSTPPKEDSFSVSDTRFLQNQDFTNCYQHAAKKIKSRKAWSAFGMGMGINLLLGLLIVSSTR